MKVGTVGPTVVTGPVASGGTETTFTGNGTTGINGQNYKVHKFTANGTLTVTTGGACEVFVLAGGGGGCDSGGGAGGLIQTPWSLSAGTYNVVVGNGGTFASGRSNPGGNSSIGSATPAGATITAYGGGGGTVAWQDGSPGGCSGGACDAVAGAVIGSQGYAGGAIGVGTYCGGGGLGGAGTTAGGPGIQSSFTGSLVSYGAGGKGTTGTANGTYWQGTANSGDGGQGYPQQSAGSSGVVIIRYPTV